MNILFNFPSNKRAVSIESLAEAFINKGHKVFFYSQEPKGPLHEFIEKFGVINFFNVLEKKSSVVFYLKHALALAKCIRKNKIELVFSHTQVANVPAVLAQYFCNTRMVICRHHSDTAYINNNSNERTLDEIINKLGKEFIVPCKKVFDQMVKEGVKPRKIKLIYYGYNFSYYKLPSCEEVEEIKNKYKCDFLIVKAARYIVEKRHMILFHLIKKLKDEGYNIKCLALSDGPERKSFEQFIEDNKLQETIYLLGFRNDILRYLSAADIVIHLSSSEASNNLVKEVGLLKKPVVVCNDVGDFDDYLQNNVNAFIINKEAPGKELEEVIRNAYNNKSSLENLGNNLHKKVLETFSIEKVISEYDNYLNS
jgi:glycosyltransferase involved in cell wall biosynthesis